MPRWLWVATGTSSRISSICSGVVAVLGEALAGAGGDQLLRAGAGGHALGLDAGERAGAVGGGDRGPEEGVDLLGGLAADRRGDGLRVAGGEGDLGAEAGLAVAHALGDLGGEVLGLERVVEDGVVDRLVDDLLEAGHVDARLARLEVDEALELGEVEAGGGVAGASMRITFSTPVTPTRERLTSVRGRRAWTSGAVARREEGGRFIAVLARSARLQGVAAKGSDGGSAASLRGILADGLRGRAVRLDPWAMPYGGGDRGNRAPSGGAGEREAERRADRRRSRAGLPHRRAGRVGARGGRADRRGRCASCTRRWSRRGSS